MVLDSLPGRVCKGLHDVAITPGFTRGLAFLDDTTMLIGQSKNRNFSSLNSSELNISLDTSVVAFCNKTKISKSFALNSAISEIHSIINLSS